MRDLYFLVAVPVHWPLLGPMHYELVSCTVPEGGLGYIDERYGDDYYIVETAEGPRTTADVTVPPPSFTDEERREAFDTGHLAMHLAMKEID